MAQYYAILTKLGSALMANAALNGTKINVTHFAVGDGGGSFYLPAETMTELRHEVWRTAVSHGEINPDSPNRLDFFAVVPPEVGGFTIREMGLFDAQNRLIGVANTPDIQKVAFADGVSYDSLLSISLAVVSPETLEYRVDPYVIIATKKDIETHNASDTAHGDIRGMIGGHLQAKNNPHGVTAAQAGAYTKAEADALLSNKANKNRQIQWTPFVLLNGFNCPSSREPALCFTKDDLGNVHINGLIARNTKPESGTMIAILPVGYRPTIVHHIHTGAPAGNNGSAWSTTLLITTDGVLRTVGDNTPTNYPTVTMIISMCFPTYASEG